MLKKVFNLCHIRYSVNIQYTNEVAALPTTKFPLPRSANNIRKISYRSCLQHCKMKKFIIVSGVSRELWLTNGDLEGFPGDPQNFI
jgi:hypothetical protein